MPADTLHGHHSCDAASLDRSRCSLYVYLRTPCNQPTQDSIYVWIIACLEPQTSRSRALLSKTLALDSSHYPGMSLARLPCMRVQNLLTVDCLKTAYIF